MINNFEEFQKLGTDNVELVIKSFSAVSKGLQAMAAETADYSKKSFEDGTAAMEKVFGANSVDKAFEAQSEFVKSAYEGFVGQATKMGNLYVELAREAYKPYENVFGKVAK